MTVKAAIVIMNKVMIISWRHETFFNKKSKVTDVCGSRFYKGGNFFLPMHGDEINNDDDELILKVNVMLVIFLT